MFGVIVGVIAILIDSIMLYKKYIDRDLVGILFWGILLICVLICR